MRPLGPGMTSNRRCEQCGERLEVDDGALCQVCRPQLSQRARVAEAARRIRQEELEALERDAQHLEMVIRKVERRVKWRQQQRRY